MKVGVELESSVTEALVTGWRVEVGDEVVIGQPLAFVMPQPS